MRTSAYGAAVLAIAALVASACAPDPATTQSASITEPTVAVGPAAVDPTPGTAAPSAELPIFLGTRSGADMLASCGMTTLAGKRVGLIANRVSKVGSTHLIDLLDAAPDVELVAAFAPEHGIRGDADAGETFGDERDPDTGTPIFSLYGRNRRPTAEMLTGIDVLVFDLQDVGTRFYTYISTMGLSMQSAAEAGIPFVVLDRPNPLGAVSSAGFVRRPEQESFVAQFPIPSVHGLTVGELALAIKGEGWMPGLEALDVQVIEMTNWSRDMLWPDTQREWISPSPGLPKFESALAYPGTVMFEATRISIGTGTRHPFSTVAAPWADADVLAARLNALNLIGVRFEPVSYVPTPIPGQGPNPRLEGELVHGVRYVFTDQRAFDPLRTGLHVLAAFRAHAAEMGETRFINRPDFLDILAGTPALREGLEAGTNPDVILRSWQAETEAFDRQMQPYRLY